MLPFTDISTDFVDLVPSTTLILLIVIKNLTIFCHLSWIADPAATYL